MHVDGPRWHFLFIMSSCMSLYCQT
uniref:Uncharacterized protein n=1 Tax=Rhizophora mucronata TaxID=61149 RepID=A0A2P2PVN1_RHIMU